MIELKFVDEEKPVYLDLQGESGSGTSNYNDLPNKPKINGNELVGDKKANDLGLVDTETYNELKKIVDDMVEKRISDILINGTSIVDENGVAGIPIASADELGLVKQGNGLYMANGKLCVLVASTAHIDGRSKGPVLKVESLGYAIKSAMCTDIDEAWTSDEKSRARARMGMEWKLLADMTLEEDVASIEIDSDVNGETFQVRKMRISFIGENSTTHARLNLYSNPTNVQDTRNMQNIYFYQAFTVGKTKKCVVEIGERLTSGVCIANCQATEYALDSPYTLAISDFKAIATRENDFLDRIKMTLGDGVFTSGTRIVIEGCE